MSVMELALALAGLAVPILGAGIASIVRGGRVLERVDQIHTLTRELHPAVERLEVTAARTAAQVDGLHTVVRDHQRMPAHMAHG